MKRVIVATLDWGLGHATRCIPVIRELLQRRCEVILAGSGDSLALLKMEFPNLRYFTLPGYNPRYSRKGSMILTMLKQLPKFFRVIQQEHSLIEKIISDHKADIIISDNRYGCWSSRIPSVFITHQSNILMPKRFGWLSGFVRILNIRYMRNFKKCWIPDFPEPETLAGQLVSFGNIRAPLTTEFIGPLSRFKASVQDENITYDVLAVFSGPEPQRTALEDIVLPQLITSGLNYFVVRGVISSMPKSGDHTADFLTSHELQQKIEASKIVIARSGYSTVMDMASLGKKVIFIPTPGQTEQEYLASELMRKRITFTSSQANFNLSVALKESEKYTGFIMSKKPSGALQDALNLLLGENN